MGYDLIHVGTGGQGKRWLERALPPNVDDGLLNIVGAVDVDEAALKNAQELADVPASNCYTDVETAFEELEADCCSCCVPPWFHEDVIEAAVEHDLHIISEKPIADTLEASIRIANMVEEAGLKMGVTMSHRFDQDKTTFRRELRSGDHGPIDYIVGRFSCALREYGSWGEFRHEMDDALLIEGGVHQLDFLADMAGEDTVCETLYADTWTPDWADYEGDCQALVQCRMDNGVRITWEGAKANAVGLNCWGDDYVRAECRDDTVILDKREIESFPYGGAGFESHAEGGGKEISLDEQAKWSNTWLIEQFVEWLDGGRPMATNVSDNLQSMALVEAAIESSKTGEPIDVQSFLAKTREGVESP